VYRPVSKYDIPWFQIDNRLNWTNLVEKLIPEISGACYAVRSMCHNINTDAVI
jgi:hypothetical protein